MSDYVFISALAVFAVLVTADLIVGSWVRILRRSDGLFMCILSKAVLTLAMLVTLVVAIGLALIPAAVVKSERLRLTCELQVAPHQILLDYAYTRDFVRKNNCEWW
jgi:hypothetical protein